MIYLENKYITEIKKELLPFYDKIEKIYAFGSRVRGNHKKYSDLDLAIKFCENTNDDVILLMKNALEESSIPIRVDLIDLDKISDEFRTMILDSLIEF